MLEPTEPLRSATLRLTGKWKRLLALGLRVGLVWKEGGMGRERTRFVGSRVWVVAAAA
jgi:hypothetical protein